MFDRDPYFREKENHLIFKEIVKKLGTVDLYNYLVKFNIVPNSEIIKVLKNSIKHLPRERIKWETLVNTNRSKRYYSPELGDLLDKILVYDHDVRLTAKDAMKHPYFNPVREYYANETFRNEMNKDLEERVRFIVKNENKVKERKKANTVESSYKNTRNSDDISREESNEQQREIVKRTYINKRNNNNTNQVLRKEENNSDNLKKESRVENENIEMKSDSNSTSKQYTSSNDNITDHSTLINYNNAEENNNFDIEYDEYEIPINKEDEDSENALIDSLSEKTKDLLRKKSIRK